MTLLENHQLNPMIDKIFPFSELPQGLNYLQQNHHQGKVVVSLIDEPQIKKQPSDVNAGAVTLLIKKRLTTNPLDLIIYRIFIFN